MIKLSDILLSKHPKNVKSVIYKIVYLPANLTLYVGQTLQSIEDRMIGHYKSNEWIREAIDKHGAENFGIESLLI